MENIKLLINEVINKVIRHDFGYNSSFIGDLFQKYDIPIENSYFIDLKDHFKEKTNRLDNSSSVFKANDFIILMKSLFEFDEDAFEIIDKENFKKDNIRILNSYFLSIISQIYELYITESVDENTTKELIEFTHKLYSKLELWDKYSYERHRNNMFIEQLFTDTSLISIINNHMYPNSNILKNIGINDEYLTELFKYLDQEKRENVLSDFLNKNFNGIRDYPTYDSAIFFEYVLNKMNKERNNDGISYWLGHNIDSPYDLQSLLNFLGEDLNAFNIISQEKDLEQKLFLTKKIFQVFYDLHLDFDLEQSFLDDMFDKKNDFKKEYLEIISDHLFYKFTKTYLNKPSSKKPKKIKKNKNQYRTKFNLFLNNCYKDENNINKVNEILILLILNNYFNTSTVLLLENINKEDIIKTFERLHDRITHLQPKDTYDYTYEYQKRISANINGVSDNTYDFLTHQMNKFSHILFKNFGNEMFSNKFFMFFGNENNLNQTLYPFLDDYKLSSILLDLKYNYGFFKLSYFENQKYKELLSSILTIKLNKIINQEDKEVFFNEIKKLIEDTPELDLNIFLNNFVKKQIDNNKINKIQLKKPKMF